MTERDIFREIGAIFKRYSKSSDIVNNLVDDLNRLYQEIELPTRFKNINSQSKEVETISDIVNRVISEERVAKEVTEEIDLASREHFLNQYELKAVNILKDILSKIKDRVSADSLVENFSAVVLELLKSERVQAIDRERAKSYDSSKYKSFKSLEF